MNRCGRPPPDRQPDGTFAPGGKVPEGRMRGKPRVRWPTPSNVDSTGRQHDQLPIARMATCCSLTPADRAAWRPATNTVRRTAQRQLAGGTGPDANASHLPNAPQVLRGASIWLRHDRRPASSSTRGCAADASTMLLIPLNAHASHWPGWVPSHLQVSTLRRRAELSRAGPARRGYRI